MSLKSGGPVLVYKQKGGQDRHHKIAVWNQEDKNTLALAIKEYEKLVIYFEENISQKDCWRGGCHWHA
jgi:hypothetical protein